MTGCWLAEDMADFISSSHERTACQSTENRVLTRRSRPPVKWQDYEAKDAGGETVFGSEEFAPYACSFSLMLCMIGKRKYDQKAWS